MNAKIISLLTSILDNEGGYIAFETEGWYLAFAPMNASGYINFKVRREDWSGYKTGGYLKAGSMEDPSSWELRFPRHSDILGEDIRSSIRTAFLNVLSGVEYPGDAPSPRGKPPGKGAKPSAKKGGGGKRKASNSDPAMDSIAAELAAMRREMEALRESEKAARENLRRVLNGEKLETGMTVSTGAPAPTGDGAITLRNRAAALLRSAISHCENGEDAPALAALNALNRIRKGR
jgi:hypothetical protein